MLHFLKVSHSIPLVRFRGSENCVNLILGNSTHLSYDNWNMLPQTESLLPYLNPRPPQHIPSLVHQVRLYNFMLGGNTTHNIFSIALTRPQGQRPLKIHKVRLILTVIIPHGLIIMMIGRLHYEKVFDHAQHWCGMTAL